MIELTILVDDFDYSDKLDKQLPMIFEALSSSGELNPVMKLACNSPEATARIVKGVLRTMSRDAKERLAVRVFNKLAADYGIIVDVCGCKAEKR